MKKVILLVILVIAIVLLLWWGSSRSSSGKVDAVKRKNFTSNPSGQDAKADIILSEDESLLSYSILVKQSARPVKSVFFSIAGERVKSIAGPQSVEKDDVILHGLWRRRDATPFTPQHAASLKQGELKVEVEFASD